MLRQRMERSEEDVVCRIRGPWTPGVTDSLYGSSTEGVGYSGVQV